MSKQVFITIWKECAICPTFTYTISISTDLVVPLIIAPVVAILCVSRSSPVWHILLKLASPPHPFNNVTVAYPCFFGLPPFLLVLIVPVFGVFYMIELDYHLYACVRVLEITTSTLQMLGKRIIAYMEFAATCVWFTCKLGCYTDDWNGKRNMLHKLNLPRCFKYPRTIRTTIIIFPK